jgi:hypothetical protein
MNSCGGGVSAKLRWPGVDIRGENGKPTKYLWTRTVNRWSTTPAARFGRRYTSLTDEGIRARYLPK